MHKISPHPSRHGPPFPLQKNFFHCLYLDIEVFSCIFVPVFKIQNGMDSEQITLIGVAVTVIVAVTGGLWGMMKYLKEFGKEFKGEIRAVRTEMREEIQSVRDEIQVLRTEMRDEFRAVRAELKSESVRMENRIRIRLHTKSAQETAYQTPC